MRTAKSVSWGALGVLTCLLGCSNQGGNNGGNGSSGGGSSKASSGSEILIGEYGSFTGTTAQFGKKTHEGIMLALDEVNAKGGLLGKKVKIIDADTASQADQAATVVKKLVNQDRVVAVLGEVASSRSMAAAPICEANKVPMVSPSSTNPRVTVGDDGRVREYVFRVCFIDPVQGPVMARFARENMKKGKAAILKDIKNDYSVGLSEVFKKDFERRGGKIVAEVSYSEGDTDFRAQLTAIKGASPDCIVIPGYYSEVGNIARQARDLGINVPLLGGDGWDDPKLMEIGRDAIDGAYFTTHFSAESKDERVQTFVKSYQAKFNEVPGGLAAMGYDAAKILFEAIARAKSTNGPAIAKALGETKDYKAVTGNITINKQHNAEKPIVVVQVKGKAFKYVATFTP